MQVLFKHVEPRHLDAEYRRPLLLMELLSYRADVLALQEVDEKMFSKYLQPQLAERGAISYSCPEVHFPEQENMIAN